MPVDFPSEDWLVVEKQAANWAADNEDVRRLIAGGWNGVAHRYAGMDCSFRALRNSLIEFPDGMPPHLDRHRQEHALFTFTSAAVSSVECGFMALFALCSTQWPDKFPIPTDMNLKKYPPGVCNAMSSVPDLVTSSERLTNVFRDSNYSHILDLRNLLSHRSTPTRKAYKSLGGGPVEPKPTEGMGIFSDVIFSVEYFDPIRAGMAITITALIQECAAVVGRHA